MVLALSIGPIVSGVLIFGWLFWIVAAMSTFFGRRKFPAPLGRRNWRPW